MHLNLGAFLHEERNQYKKGLKLIEKALKLAPQYPRAHCQLGILYLDFAQQFELEKKFGKVKYYYELSEKHFQIALGMNQIYLRAHFGYAQLLEKLKRFEESEMHYFQALEINPRATQIRIALGKLLSIECQNHESALMQYLTVLQFDEGCIEARFLVAIMYAYKMKKIPLAKQELSKS